MGINKNLKKASPVPAGLLISILSVLFLGSCEDLGMFMSNIDDDVKIANDRYLEVVGTFPEQNDNNLSPRTQILLTLDREVDPEQILKYLKIEQRDVSGVPTVFADPDTETDDASLELEFNLGDRTLSVTPVPFFDGGKKVTITLAAGAPAADGSFLRDDMAWSFYTVRMPVGIVDIADGAQLAANDHAESGYTNEADPAITITYSNADQYFITDDLATEVGGYTYDHSSFTGWANTLGKSGSETVDDFSFDWSGDDPEDKTLYVVFRDTTTDTLSVVESDTVFFDEDPPVITGAGTNLHDWTNTPVTRAATYISTEDSAGSGFQKVVWDSVYACDFTNQDGTSVDIEGPDDFFMDNMPVTARVYDRAGNGSGTRTVTIDWDARGPSIPRNFAVNTTDGENKPEWTWDIALSDEGSGVQDRYYYSYNGGTWYATTGNSYQQKDKFTRQPIALADGLHTLRLRQYDNLNNLSSAISESIEINTAGITPFNTETGVSTIGTRLEWPGTLGATYSYKLERWTGSSWLKGSTISTGTNAYSGILILESPAAYRWYYTVSTRFGSVTEGPYYFATGK